MLCSFCASKNRELRVNCSLVSRPRFSALNIFGQVRELVDDVAGFRKVRWLQTSEYRDHQQVRSAKTLIEPLPFPKLAREPAKAVSDVALQQRQSVVKPSLVFLEKHEGFPFDDRRLDRI